MYALIFDGFVEALNDKPIRLTDRTIEW